jgi:hypothetical protein
MDVFIEAVDPPAPASTNGEPHTAATLNPVIKKCDLG